MHRRFHDSLGIIAPSWSRLQDTLVLSLGNPFASFGLYGLLGEMIDVCLADSATFAFRPDGSAFFGIARGYLRTAPRPSRLWL